MPGLFSWLFRRGSRRGAAAPKPGGAGDERRGEDPAPTTGAVKVILGLGNPGSRYENTRHNVGWWVVDHLAEEWRADGWRKDGEARVASARLGNVRLRLVKPLTYMNLSGAVLRPYKRRKGWRPNEDLLVVVDDVALPLGRFRFRAKGSAGGHNGLRSVESALDSQDYSRLRIGIKPADDRRQGRELRDFVLDRFGRDEAEVVRELIPTLGEAIRLWADQGIVAAMNRYPGNK